MPAVPGQVVRCLHQRGAGRPGRGRPCAGHRPGHRQVSQDRPRCRSNPNLAWLRSSPGAPRSCGCGRIPSPRGGGGMPMCASPGPLGNSAAELDLEDAPGWLAGKPTEANALLQTMAAREEDRGGRMVKGGRRGGLEGWSADGVAGQPQKSWRDKPRNPPVANPECPQGHFQNTRRTQNTCSRKGFR